MSSTLRKTTLLFLAIASFFVTLTHGYECDRYCHQSCSEYFGGYQFGDCVSANVHCNCSSQMSASNPLVWFGLTVVIFFSIAICCACQRHCNRGHIPHNSVIAQPIQSTVGQQYNGNMTNGYSYASQPASAPYIAATPYPQAHPAAFIAAAPVQQKPPEISAEYLPPPAYNECVLNIDSTNGSNANQVTMHEFKSSS
ncbi:unnamed protein product [Orchesella dallaii]|uniref:Uncharacterized protein n=1 Tax=Orchesella dallaii TaxID=48710 RepID=A0ABP1RXU4_9HEXA